MNRRNFLTNLSLIGAGSSLILNSCETTNDSNTTENLDADLQVLTDAANFEASGIATYVAAANSGLLKDQAVIDTALSFKSQHEQHLAALNIILADNNRNNISADSAEPVPGTATVTNQNDILLLAMDVEFQAAAFYFTGITQTVSTFAVRKVFANIFPMEVTHAVAYKNVLGRTPGINSGLFEEFNIGS